MIDNQHHKLTFAENGRVAVELACKEDFDLILMDISMPEMDGVEATRAIRAEEKVSGKPSTTIIALTAHAIEGESEEFLAAGMNDYLTKPASKKK